MRVLMVFIDGIGLGDLTPANPFVFAEMPRLRAMLGGSPLTSKITGFQDSRVTLLGLDASMGVSGLPQSATGQASIFTGVNAPRLIGRHLSGFPNSALRALLAEKGIFGRLNREGFSCTFANAYRPPFFELLAQGLSGRHYSCSTLITFYGGLTFHDLDDLRKGKALYMDIDNSLLKKMGFDVPYIVPEEAGRRLLNISREYDFTLFEYFLSDIAGHSSSREEAAGVLSTLDRFLGAVMAAHSAEEELIIITSDHGNLEDISHRRHTASSVPALLVGSSRARSLLAPRIADLAGLLPAVITAFKL